MDLKNFKKDKFTSFQDLEKYEHVGSKVTCTQDGKRSQDDQRSQEAQRSHIRDICEIKRSRSWHVITVGDFQPIQKNPKTDKDENVSYEKKNDDLKKSHQGNSQVKDSKIDLLVQQYKQFFIPKDESIDSGFAMFYTIVTSLKAIDEIFSSKNYVRKFLRALHPKWRAKVTAIEDSKEFH
ncbi:hypothetical protein Tco_1016387 [Tanacetum coccineum]|uniref:UBN2 domain-containing protein n=1 Tax=Tanacetum coccineum TaxID=301880 RepID=A0ABQ5FNI5_9ASTR